MTYQLGIDMGGTYTDAVIVKSLENALTHARELARSEACKLTRLHDVR